MKYLWLTSALGFTVLGIIFCVLLIGELQYLSFGNPVQPTPTPVVVYIAPTPEPTPWPTPEPTPTPKLEAEIVRLDNFYWRMYIPAGEWTDTKIVVTFDQNIEIHPSDKTEGVHRFMAKLGNRELYSYCGSMAPFGHFDGLKIQVGECAWVSSLFLGKHGYALREETGWDEKLFLKAHPDVPQGINLLVNVGPCGNSCNRRGTWGCVNRE